MPEKEALRNLLRLHNQRRNLQTAIVERTEQGLPTSQLENILEKSRWASSAMLDLMDAPPQAMPREPVVLQPIRHHVRPRNLQLVKLIAAFMAGVVTIVAIDMIPGVNPGDIVASALHIPITP